MLGKAGTATQSSAFSRPTARRFCDLSGEALQRFESLTVASSYSKKSTLFLQGQPSTGVYLLCSGRVKLRTYSKEGKAIILQMAEAGDLLGLSSTYSDCAHEATAEAAENCQVKFIGKKDFLDHLQKNPEASMIAVHELSKQYQAAYTQIRVLALSSSIAERLSRLLLEWLCKSSNRNGSAHLELVFTHEEIAEMIGTSRETVTRLMRTFRERNLIQQEGSQLTIPNIKNLEAAIGIRHEDTGKLATNGSPLSPS